MNDFPTPEELAHNQRPLTRKEIIMLDLNDKWEEGNAEKIIELVHELDLINHKEHQANNRNEDGV
jgi:hypothetical protein